MHIMKGDHSASKGYGGGRYEKLTELKPCNELTTGFELEDLGTHSGLIFPQSQP